MQVFYKEGRHLLSRYSDDYSRCADCGYLMADHLGLALPLAFICEDCGCCVHYDCGYVQPTSLRCCSCIAGED